LDGQVSGDNRHAHDGQDVHGCTAYRPPPVTDPATICGTRDNLAAQAAREPPGLESAHRSRQHTDRHDGTGIAFTTSGRSLLEAHDPRAALGTGYPVTIEYGEPITLL
jgi:hypothetical protein